MQLLLSPRLGGAETLAASLTTAFEAEQIAAPVEYVDPEMSLGRFGRYKHVRSRIMYHNPDVILAHSALPNIYARVAVGSTPVVAILHSASDDMQAISLRLAERALQRRTAALVAVSRSAADEYQEWFPKSKLEVIPNGVVSGPSKMAFRQSGPIRFVSMARVAQQKDPATWLAIARAYVRRDVNSDSSFVWYGPVSEEFRSIALDDANGRIRFAGPADDVQSTLLNADVLLHTSRREAHPIAILEAAAIGLPVVCTDTVASVCGPLIEKVSFRAGDTEDGLAALGRLCDQWTEVARRAIDAASKIQSVYGIASTARSYSNIIRSVVSADR